MIVNPNTHMHAHTHTHKLPNPELNACRHKELSKMDLLINVIEKVSAVALGIFSAYVSAELFVPFFLASISIGIYSYFQDKNSCMHSHGGSSCAHGLLEQLTGVKLPPIISLAANIAVTVCHIDHHSTVFVPVIATSLGAWLGKLACQYGSLIHKDITAHVTQKSHGCGSNVACC